jgi:hypothetical protein
MALPVESENCTSQLESFGLDGVVVISLKSVHSRDRRAFPAPTSLLNKLPAGQNKTGNPVVKSA